MDFLMILFLFYILFSFNLSWYLWTEDMLEFGHLSY